MSLQHLNSKPFHGWLFSDGTTYEAVLLRRRGRTSELGISIQRTEQHLKELHFLQTWPSVVDHVKRVISALQIALWLFLLQLSDSQHAHGLAMCAAEIKRFFKIYTVKLAIHKSPFAFHMKLGFFNEKKL